MGILNSEVDRLRHENSGLEFEVKQQAERITELEAECDRRGKLLKETIDAEVAQIDEIKRMRGALTELTDVGDKIARKYASFMWHVELIKALRKAKAALEGEQE